MSGPTGQGRLRLSLSAHTVLPDGPTWSIREGYIRTVAWNEEGEFITLGIWGPGEWVTTAFSTLSPV